MNGINKIFKGDKVIWTVALLLILVSTVAVYSATGTYAHTKYDGNTGRVLIKHVGTLLFGFLAMYATYRVDYHKFSKLFMIIFWICIPLLIYTMLFGTNLNSASRSIRILGISFQTSDFAKIALITYLSRQLVKSQEYIKDFKKAVIPLIIPILITVGLILPENLSTAVMLLISCMVLMFIGRVKIVHILAIFGIGVGCFAIYVLIMLAKPADERGRVGTWQKRIEASKDTNGENGAAAYDPFDNSHYQETHSKIAIAGGGITGKGPGKSTQRNFLPHPYSDFVFAIIVEEYGILGACFIVLLYCVLLFRAMKIVTARPLTFGAFMSFGLSFLLVFQAMINMAVAVGLAPVTGQPLPFVSMGGSSILTTGIAIGMILSVTKDMEKEREEQKAQEEQEALEAQEEKETVENTDIDERPVEICH